MKVYTAIWRDRHTDVTAHVFSTSDRAIKWARKTAKKYSDNDEYEEHNIHGWLFHASYTGESDCIYVVESDLDGEV